MNDLPEPLAQASKDKWNALCAAAKEKNISFPDDPVFVSRLKRILALSDFVARSFLNDPFLLKSLMEKNDMERSYGENEYIDALASSVSALPDSPDQSALSTMLRSFRNREMVRIAWRDLAGLSDLAETMRDLSALADACLDQAAAILYGWQCAKSGIPMGTDGSRQHLVILGLGKLGGRELNFSSDVDLVFAYPEPGETTGGRTGPISNEEFFARLGRDIIKVIGEHTSKGFVFRVDIRLRPFGESGPIAMSFDSMEEYYQTQGREWERYAWIKARVVAGDRETGNELLQRLKPFVYRRYLDFGVFESLREMKQKISLETKREKLKDNIKLGPGGIREIEFFGQVFQLTRGGVDPSLQQRSILKVLNALESRSYIPHHTCVELSDAYKFLRNTEHRLQEFADRQIHELPQDYTGKIRLATSMGFPDWRTFVSKLKGHMESVHSHFSKLLEAGDPGVHGDKDTDKLAEVWKDRDGQKRRENILLKAGFDEPKKAINILNDLHDSHATRTLSIEGRMRLDKLIPLVLKNAATSKQPLLILNRLINLIMTIQKRTNYLALLLENPGILVHLVRLAEASPWIISFLSQHPVLLDELIDPRTLYTPPEKGELEKEIHRRLEGVSTQDLEGQMTEICIFRQANMLRVAAADVTGAIPLMRVSDYLTELAETVLKQVLELAWTHLVQRHGNPSHDMNNNRSNKGFCIVAYGKLGGIELGYGSDLDLVFLHSATKGQTTGLHPIDNARFFARLGERIIHILTAHTPAGVIYETDMRLRPDGSAGLLVINIEAFRDYQINKAWTWEHQALIKARAICGDKKLQQKFEDIRQEVLSRRREKGKLREDVIDMRERLRKEQLNTKSGMFDIKHGPGGMVDIEFLVQYLVLLHAHKFPELLKWTDNIRLIDTLMKIGIIDDERGALLKKTYLTYRSTVHMLNLQEKKPVIPEEEFSDLRKEIKKVWLSLIMHTS